MILEGFKFTNSLFLDNFTKFFIVVFPIYVIQFLVYLAFGSVPGNEFGTHLPLRILPSNFYLIYLPSTLML